MLVKGPLESTYHSLYVHPINTGVDYCLVVCTSRIPKWSLSVHVAYEQIRADLVTSEGGKEVIYYGYFTHDDVIKWKHFTRYWPFVRGIHRSPVNSSHKGQWRGALMFSVICVRINGWVNNREAGDLKRYRAHYDVTVMRITAVT